MSTATSSAPSSAAPNSTKLPYTLVIGQKEAEAGSVSVRSRARGDEGVMTANTCVARAKAEVTTRALPEKIEKKA